MKLTKERCLNALDVMCNECDEESAEILSQLIDEHFESSLTREKLEKALDKALDSLVELDEVTVEAIGGYTWNKEEWKEYLLNED